MLKKRIARRGQGKSGSFRTIVATNRGNRWFFVYGFAKNERANIDDDEEAALKKLAETVDDATRVPCESRERGRDNGGEVRW